MSSFCQNLRFLRKVGCTKLVQFTPCVDNIKETPNLQGNILIISRHYSNNGSATVHLENGLPRFRIPLPSRAESCQFTMKPLSNSVGDLCDSIQGEDKGVDRVAFYTTDGIRIARSNSIEQLLTNDFEIQVNDRSYPVRSPLQTMELSETYEAVNDVKNLITKLSMDLNIEEYQLSKEKDLFKKLERLQEELAPLEDQRQVLANVASRRTRYLTWLGLGAMGLQFGLLARLTWWEYSWDIMEPVTYFVGYGTSIAMFAYYVVTRQEYIFPAVFDREYLKKFYTDAEKQKFDIDHYNSLRDQITTVESDIRRLRDPLMLNLPLQQLSLKSSKSAA